MSIDMKWLAHITKDENQSRREHTLRDHSISTARRCADLMKSVGMYHTGYTAGLLHDMGKAKQKFQDYLEACFRGEKVRRGSVNHTFAGVIWLFERYHQDKETKAVCLTCEMISYAMGAHHGLFDCLDLDGVNGFEYRLKKDRQEIDYEESRRNFFTDCIPEEEIQNHFEKAVQECACHYGKWNEQWEGYRSRGQCRSKRRAVFFLIGMLERMLLSALTEADRSDTAGFMTGSTVMHVDTDLPPWERQLCFLEKKLEEFVDGRSGKGKPEDEELNKARRAISDFCWQRAQCETGIYKICETTGSGKTLALLRFALAHAAFQKKQRLIFVIPLLSVLEQNSGVIREFIEDPSLILEHHSNVVLEKASAHSDNKRPSNVVPEKASAHSDNKRPSNVVQEKASAHSDNERPSNMSHEKSFGELDEYELLTENWQSPMIVTTMVQLLNTLFSGKLSAVRRLQALRDSVLVIDEIQNLPLRMYHMFNMAMNFLKDCGATIVLSSATQPCLEKTGYPMIMAEACELVPVLPEFEQVFRRTRLEDKVLQESFTTETLTDFVLERMESVFSLLLICNTKRTAVELYEALKESTDGSIELLHLSTAMCMEHRSQVVNSMKRALVLCKKREKKLICVATQLVEAGVDISFETVVRSWAGLDSVIQAAGRCNRNGEYGEICDVFVVRLKGENLGCLPEIVRAQDCMLQLTEEYANNPERFDGNLMSWKSIDRYFTLLLRENTAKDLSYPVCRGTLTLFGMLSDNPVNRSEQSCIMKQAFGTAGRIFHVFEENTVDVVVPYDEKARRAIGELKAMEGKRQEQEWKRILNRLRPYTIQIYEYQKKELERGELLTCAAEEHVLLLSGEAYNQETGLERRFHVESYIS